MDRGFERDPGRGRTAILRMGMRIAGVEWEDGDEEDGERYGMRAIPWRQWEAYGVAIWIGIFVAGVSVLGLGQVVTPSGWLFWVLVPVALLVGFLGLQAVMIGGAILVWLMRRIGWGGKIREANWVSGVVLLGLTAMAVGMCWLGGVWGWVIGTFWLVPVGLNGAAWSVEQVVEE